MINIVLRLNLILSFFFVINLNYYVDSFILNGFSLISNPFNTVLKSSNFYNEILNCDTKFEDIAGCDYLKEEVMDIIDFLKEPIKYKKMGAKLPKGILLSGPPGTGKTLVARAIAGEANIPFFATVGSAFNEIYIGQGARRVRELFEKARSVAPAIIFIDEIDAIGGQRGRIGSTSEEREATLNQVLAEIDGILESEIIVIAATNRVDMLDPALIRSGRLERKISTILPDLIGRQQILKVHSKNKNLSEKLNLNLNNFAEQMYYLNGADIGMIMNNAAINACKTNSTEIEILHLQNSLNSFLFGSKLKERVISDEILKGIITHELGHAIIATHFGFDKVAYITCIPNSRGSAGLTYYKPNKDFIEFGVFTKEYLIARVSSLLAGRAAEEIIYGDNKITTGAKTDIAEAKQLATRIINEFGMSSDEILVLNSELKVKNLIDYIFKKTKLILSSKKDLLIFLSDKLYDKKEFYEKDFEDLIKYYPLEQIKNEINTFTLNPILEKNNTNLKNESSKKYVILEDSINDDWDCLIVPTDELIS